MGLPVGSSLDLAPLTAAPAAPTSGSKLYARGDGRLYTADSTGAITLAGSVRQLEPVKAASFSNLTLSGTQNIDGANLVAGDRVLAQNQTATAENGVYVVAAGAWSRAPDANTAANVDRGTTVFSTGGNINRLKEFTQLLTVTTLGTDQQQWRVLTTIDAGGSAGIPIASNIGHTFYNTDAQAFQIWDGGGWRMANGLKVVTSSTNPTTSIAGAFLYETDTNQTKIYDGTSWQLVNGGSGGLTLAQAKIAVMTSVVLSGLQTLEGVTLVAGDRVLLLSQAVALENGIWIAAAGAWTRAPDANTAAKVVRGTSIWTRAGAPSTQRKLTKFTQVGDVTNFATDLQHWRAIEIPELVNPNIYPPNPFSGQVIYDYVKRQQLIWDAGLVSWQNTGGVITGTSTTYPSTPGIGSIFYETDTGQSRFYDGSDWRPLDNRGQTLAAVRAVTTANIALTGLQSVDGVALAAGDRVLVRTQTTGGDNGIYIAATGAWMRANDCNTAAEVKQGTEVYVREGTFNRFKVFRQMNAVTTFGTDTTVWRPHVAMDVINWLTYPTPIQGTTVYNTSSRAISVYDGSGWGHAHGTWVVTSATRPSNPVPGNIVYETDTSRTVVWDGTTWQPIGTGGAGGGKEPTQQTFTTVGAGIWTKPQGCVYVVVEVQAGGGGGGGAGPAAANQHANGAGGGGGGSVKCTYLAGQLNSTEAILIGGGGAGGSAAGGGGAEGNTSAFSGGANVLMAYGGGAGQGSVSDPSSYGMQGGVGGGAGGATGPAGAIASPGQPGDGSYGAGGFATSGSGGGSQFGSGGVGKALGTYGYAIAGAPGAGYGGGGSGGMTTSSSGTGAAGGAGTSGIIIVTEYYAAGSGNQPIDSWGATATATTTLNTNAWIDITGCSVTVPVTSPNDRFLVVANADCEIYGSGLGFIDLFVGGGRYGDMIIQGASGSRSSIGLNTTVTGLTPGNVVFKLMGMNYTNTGSATAYSGNTKFSVVKLSGGTDGGVIICTSTTRPQYPVKGDEIFETDTGYNYVWDGTTWRSMASSGGTAGVWQNYTSTVTGGSMGSTGSVNARWAQVGNTVHFEIVATFGGSGASITGSGTLNFSLPVQANLVSGFNANVNCHLLSSGVNLMKGDASLSTTYVSPSYNLVNSGQDGWLANITSTAPFAWKAGDAIYLTGSYTATTTVPAGGGGGGGNVSGWGDFTPTYTTFTWSGARHRFMRAGNRVDVTGEGAVASTPGGSALVFVTVPIAGTPATTTYGKAVGTWSATRLGVTHYGGQVMLDSTGTKIYFRRDGSGSEVTPSTPTTWVVGDVFSWSYSYEITSDATPVAPISDTGWVIPTLQNGWVNYGAPYSPAGYRRVGNRVKLRGLIKNGSNASTIFLLPPNCVPVYILLLSGLNASVQTSGPSTGAAHTHSVSYPVRVDVSPNGTVVMQDSLATNGWLCLDEIEFYVD